jgi:osomolarity two-component system sensor histidine kinase NIK1
MSREDEILSATTAIISDLARGSASPRNAPTSTRRISSPNNDLTLPIYKLPGAATPTKRAFEAEVAALQRRIQYLEARADTVGQALPDTPGEVQRPTSPFGKSLTYPAPNADAPGSPAAARPGRQPQVTNRAVRVSNLLAARDPQLTERDPERVVSEDDISYLREHVEKQADQIKTQRDTIAEISVGLQKSEEQAAQAFMRAEHEDAGVLERELRKHQQANEAFQKALREIGGIITQVANGDLSKRVQIQATEMDAEIAAFKVTINTMMDQLEVFGSEVSRVAREVGTEGILGGQAQISGVHGIWKELTENGKQYRVSVWRLLC